MERNPSTRPEPAQPGAPTKIVVPLAREEVEVTKRQAERERVRVTKTVEADEFVVDAPFVREELRVEHVPIHRTVEASPPIRTEGDTTIIPVVEEVLTLERRMVLKEEIRITKTRVETTHRLRETVRRERANVERITADGRPDDSKKQGRAT